MPIYNEEESLDKTFSEWKNETNKYQTDWKFDYLLVNDGSTDNTINIIKKIEQRNPNVKVIDKINSGHGASCLLGYNYGLENKYNYIMQLDSDGQCDPVFFEKFLNKISQGKDIVYGIRYYRKDGILRFFISRILSIIAFLKLGRWVWDPNVPYRIFKTKTVESFISKISKDYFLINVFLALHHKKSGIAYVPIVFRDRWGGSPSLNTFKIIQHGKTFIKQLRIFKTIDL
jgi:glycosyltransferase involved in cell wall biosynthesis